MAGKLKLFGWGVVLVLGIAAILTLFHVFVGNEEEEGIVTTVSTGIREKVKGWFKTPPQISDEAIEASNRATIAAREAEVAEIEAASKKAAAENDVLLAEKAKEKREAELAAAEVERKFLETEAANAELRKKLGVTAPAATPAPLPSIPPSTAAQAIVPVTPPTSTSAVAVVKASDAGVRKLAPGELPGAPTPPLPPAPAHHPGCEKACCKGSSSSPKGGARNTAPRRGMAPVQNAPGGVGTYEGVIEVALSDGTVAKWRIHPGKSIPSQPTIEKAVMSFRKEGLMPESGGQRPPVADRPVPPNEWQDRHTFRDPRRR